MPRPPSISPKDCPVLWVHYNSQSSQETEEDPTLTPLPVATDTPVPTATPAPTDTPSPTQTPEPPGFDAGMYKVGSDMPSGEYKLFCIDSFLSSAYYEVTKDSSGTLDSILANDNFGTFTYLTVQDGQYLKLERCRAVPISDALPYDAADGEYSEGTHKIGYDMPADEYKLFAADTLLGMAYFQVSSDSIGTLEGIVANDNFGTFSYMTVSDGQYLTLTRCSAKASSDVAPYALVDGRYTEGMYRVGVDIPPGEYRVQPEEDTSLGFGYYEVDVDSMHSINSIVANDNFEDARYVTVSEGQYLLLSNAFIEP